MDILNNRLIKTELVEWKKLIPFQPDNLKKTEPHKLQKLANSLCQNGFSMNFYVWEKDGQILIIDGHSRHEVLQLLESGAIYPKDPDGKEYAVTIPDKLPCSFLHLKNKTEAKKAVLIYNSKYKNIDSDMLAEWVSDLNLYELKSQIEIPELKLDFDMPQELENDSIDDTAKIKTNIKVGDLIEIGRHRLLCGDSTKKEDVERLMNGKKADMVFTDPPYGYKYESNYQSKHKQLTNDDKILNFIPLVIPSIKDNTPLYIFCGWQTLQEWINEVKKTNLVIKNLIVWKKNNWSMGDLKGSYAGQYEIMIYSHNGRYEFKDGKRGQDIWEFNRVAPYEHPTVKPVELIQKAINDSINNNEICLDLFLGSGSTIVACQTLQRTCYGMELEPIYCQVIINRMRKNFPELEIKVNGKEYKES
jgi:DNA modification methylase